MATRPCSAFAVISAFPILLVEIPGDPVPATVLPFADVVHEQLDQLLTLGAVLTVSKYIP
jgi:hypothetical protein